MFKCMHQIILSTMNNRCRKSSDKVNLMKTLYEKELYLTCIGVIYLSFLVLFISLTHKFYLFVYMCLLNFIFVLHINEL